jgi:ornithine cyclodeaminase/alanine dehydrogenase-like protein (mu-crystallin family)
MNISGEEETTMSGTWILGTEGIAAVVREVGLDGLFDELIERLRDAFDRHDPEQMATFDRTGFHYTKPDLGLVEWMPAMDLGRLVSIKTVGYHPSNPVERATPSVLATTTLHDTSTGRLLALCEATFLTALRTGAASAVATDVLARTDASTLGMVGCGAQAVTQIHAISRVRPIERVLAFDTQPEVAATLAQRLAGLDHLNIETVDGADLTRLAAESDIICTATTVGIGDPPVLPELEHRPWVHINAVGADFAGKLELDRSWLRDALVCPDVIEQCLIEGECQQLDRNEIGPDLVTLVQQQDAWATHHRDRPTVFDSTGWALQDLVAAEMMLDHACRLGEGLEIELQPSPADPYDPYEFVRA